MTNEQARQLTREEIENMADSFATEQAQGVSDYSHFRITADGALLLMFPGFTNFGGYPVEPKTWILEYPVDGLDMGRQFDFSYNYDPVICALRQATLRAFAR